MVEGDGGGGGKCLDPSSHLERATYEQPQQIVTEAPEGDPIRTTIKSITRHPVSSVVVVVVVVAVPLPEAESW